MKKQHITISPYIATQLVKTKDLKFYAVWIYLKALYSNSCIYNYTILSLSSKSGLSPSTIRKYIPMFLATSYCRLHKGNLVFCKHTQLPDKRPKKKCLYLNEQFVRDWSVNGIVEALEAWLIKNAERQELYATSKAKGDKRYRDASSENLQGMAFSVSKAARLFKCSKATASRKLRKLATRGWYNRTFIRPKPYDDPFISFNPHALNAFDGLKNLDLGDASFTYKGKLYRCWMSRIDWLPEICPPPLATPNNMLSL